MSKSSELPKSLLTVEENSIIGLLQYVGSTAEDLDNPEEGDYLDRLERLFRTADQLDSLVVKIAIDRTHFFMGNWQESYFSASSYEVIPDRSPATDRLYEALEKTSVTESSGVKRDVLDAVDNLQVEYFWRDALNPETDLLDDLTRLFTDHLIADLDLYDFVASNILQPWDEFLEDDPEDIDGYDLSLWNAACERFARITF